MPTISLRIQKLFTIQDHASGSSIDVVYKYKSTRSQLLQQLPFKPEWECGSRLPDSRSLILSPWIYPGWRYRPGYQ